MTRFFVRISSLLIAIPLANCRNSVHDDPRFEDAYYIYFHPTGGLRRDSTYLFGKEESRRLQSVLRVYGYESVRDTGNGTLRIPAELAHDSVLWANMIEKANDPDWLRGHLPEAVQSGYNPD